jgi:hypothetical protein
MAKLLRFFCILALPALTTFCSAADSKVGEASSSSGTTYYVDSSTGSDANDGLSQATAWNSLSKVNSASLQPGDKVLFRRGQIWRGQLFPISGSSGAPITYADYDSGALPVILGSVDGSSTSQWSLFSGNIWIANTSIPKDIGNMYFGTTPTIGVKKWTAGDLLAQGDFFYDRSTGYVKIYSTSNPGSFYSHIELALTQDMIVITNKSYVSFENLALKFGGANGVNGSNSSNMTFRGFEISYMGGGDMNMDGSNIRYGNGIQFWQGAHDHVVERNLFWEIYDTAVSNQAHTAVSEVYNIVYKNNLIWNMGFAAVELWNYGPGISKMWNIYYVHNTSINPGTGWGGVQRPDLKGMHVLLDTVSNEPDNVVIKNNIYYGGNVGLYVKHASSAQWNSSSLFMDYNDYYTPSVNIVTLENLGLNYTMAQLANYQAATSCDLNSTVANPLFTNVSSPPSGLSLQGGSPLLNYAPAISGVSDDFYGTVRGVNVDLGAVEQ